MLLAAEGPGHQAFDLDWLFEGALPVGAAEKAGPDRCAYGVMVVANTSVRLLRLPELAMTKNGRNDPSTWASAS